MSAMNEDGSAGRRSTIEKEAIAWFTRMNGKPSSADRKHFQAWLKADTAHGTAFEELRSWWSATGEAGADLGRGNDAALEKHLENVRSMRAQNKTRKVGGVVAICLLSLVAGSWIWLEKPALLQDMRADYVTERGERRSIPLEDGSTVLLDADTAINVDMATDERRVRLLRGAAFFRVQSSAVPFVVEAANGRSQVLGTTFDVAMADRDVSVTLATGSLQVTVDGVTKGVVLIPGEEVAYGASGMGQARKIDLDEVMAWHEGRYVFTNARLSDVLRQIERYHGGRIIVIGSALAEKRVSGSFSLEDTDAALASVRSSVGFRMNSIGGRVVIIGP